MSTKLKDKKISIKQNCLFCAMNWKKQLVQINSGWSILVLNGAKLGTLREPITIPVFIVYQFSHINKCTCMYYWVLYRRDIIKMWKFWVTELNFANLPLKYLALWLASSYWSHQKAVKRCQTLMNHFITSPWQAAVSTVFSYSHESTHLCKNNAQISTC